MWGAKRGRARLRRRNCSNSKRMTESTWIKLAKLTVPKEGADIGIEPDLPLFLEDKIASLLWQFCSGSKEGIEK